MNAPTATGFIEQMFNTVQTGLLLSKAVYDNTGQIVDFQVTRCNDMACQICGLSSQDLLSKPILELDPATRHNGLFESWKKILQTGVPQRFEYLYTTRNLWLDVSISKWEDLLICSVSNINPQKQAEDQQQKQAITLQGILDTIPVGVWISEAIRDNSGQIIDFRIVEANKQAKQAANIDNRPIINHLASELFPQDRTNGVYNRFLAVVEQQQPQQFLLEIPRNQQTAHLNIMLVPHRQDQVISTSLDATSLRLAEQEAHKQAELLDQVFNSSQIALTLHEPIRNDQGKIIDFAITKMNDTAARWMQLPANQAHRLSDLMPEFPKSFFFQVYSKVIETGEPASFEHALSRFIYEFKVAKSGDGLVISANNITRMRQHQLELEQANLDLSRSNENLQQFAYVASHDLQEPLRKIQAFGDILHNQYGMTVGEQGLDIIKRMQTASQRMSSLIADLLSYSRLSTQREAFRAVSLHRLIKEMIEDLEVTIQEQQAAIDVQYLPTVLGDRLQLRQLFQNLLSNSLKFRREGVAPAIQISSVAASTSELPKGLNSAQPYHLISISDNGIGFDEKYIDRIFQVFQRLHGRGHYSGTGVGLAICRKVVENHNGAIVASSRPGQGSTFRVYLPA